MAQRAHIFRAAQPLVICFALIGARKIVIGCQGRQVVPGCLDDPRHPAGLGQAERSGHAPFHRLPAQIVIGRYPPMAGSAGRRYAAAADIAFINQHDLGTLTRRRNGRPAGGHAAADDQNVGFKVKHREVRHGLFQAEAQPVQRIA